MHDCFENRSFKALLICFLPFKILFLPLNISRNLCKGLFLYTKLWPFLFLSRKDVSLSSMKYVFIILNFKRYKFMKYVDQERSTWNQTFKKRKFLVFVYKIFTSHPIWLLSTITAHLWRRIRAKRPTTNHF